jgi:hypothetical protein
MIYFNFAVENPWRDRWNTIWFKNGLLPKHKAWEFNGYRTHQLINFNFKLNFKGDHAGLQIELGLLGYNVEFNVYDTRHWDYEHDCWELL